MKSYAEHLRAQMLARQSVTTFPSNRLTSLANQINAWHDKRTVPERWNPVMLGRIAALFGVTRELAAMAMLSTGWKERKTGTTSLWLAPIDCNK
ncbi:MAG: hypothetical protein Q8M99_02665 [Methylotenera sp.]|nr:hypothetical protein [Methylotenera sp.]